ncbi:bacteriorhodopsin [Candidatus Marinimicrobia bacterium]|nr:bacteriorhodopsin-like [Candidatus Neomarinimicrobiota bacterium]MDB3883352.1 bacteriorhodopsin-like [Candidatus Neomarinimicrobiota bacterium]MDC0593850.1 bacteriorhodopsin-like [Candidatus Neomarinimicrobiota bacterium]MDC0878506.1 bacteriorhodopsin [Candidatus Neomarinimicrobiota bacterium]MDC1021057.1 bacteriorhodopsin [Candidatus Neomarinimicrobiota bacterium]|tara:strand:- start:356 stop:1048 length:693 start_codon:yes stop_codon:yes gene_type:complete
MYVINLMGMDPSTLTGFTFFVVNMALLAAALFFWLERDNVNPKWKTSLTVSGLVCFIAAVHYFYMRDAGGTDVVAIRYIDWLITVPLLMVELYIVLLAVTNVGSGVFKRLLAFTTLMLVFGYLGETQVISSTIGFVGGMLFWGLALKEIWSGEAAEANAGSKNAAGQYAYVNLKNIVTFGWLIYPAGYALGYFGGGVDMDLTNQVYNLADFVNKILPGVIVWVAAKMDTK